MSSTLWETTISDTSTHTTSTSASESTDPGLPTKCQSYIAYRYSCTHFLRHKLRRQLCCKERYAENCVSQVIVIRRKSEITQNIIRIRVREVIPIKVQLQVNEKQGQL